MLTRLYPLAMCGLLACELSIAAGAQVGAASAGSMVKPPPVSGKSYVLETGLEQKKNFISGGIVGGVGYVDNLYPGTGGNLSEAILSLQPRIAFETSTARESMALQYSPNFILYQPDAAYNEADHELAADLSYEFTPRLAMTLSDHLLRSSNGFWSGSISGSAETTTPGVIVPWGERLWNEASGGLSYQFSPHGMIGGDGNVGFLNYNSKAQGLFNSDSRGGGGFYSARIAASQYLGAIYQYQQSLSYPTGQQYETQTHAFFGFYTLYLTESLSVSVSGGPQHYISESTGIPSISAWTPAMTASLGWQARHVALAASFTRVVTGGSGLIGTFYSKNANIGGRWEMSRLWSSGANVSYAINKDAVPGTALGSPGGHSFSASANISRRLMDRMSGTLTYDRIQTRFDGIPSLASNPSSDRVMATLEWHFNRSIGR